jgi:hypothetical protein
VLIVTISQHGPHDARDPMADYVQRFEASERDYEAFLEALQTRGKRAGVVAFGDHQPDFTHERIAEDRDRYLTAYDLRCVNFACAGAAVEAGTLALDSAMLAPAALERFGFALDGLSLFQRRVFETCADDLERCDDSARQEFNAAFSTYFE